MGDMAIAAVSVGMHQAKAQQELGMSVLKMAMEENAGMVDELMEDMAVSLDPNLGANIDIFV